MPVAAAGWYPDPSNNLQQRYWDGAAWTEKTLPLPAPSTLPPTPPTPPPPGTRVPGTGEANPHWVLSVVVSVLLFPIGLVSLLFSVLCTNATTARDDAQAAKYSSYAKTSAIVFLALAAATFVLVLVLVLFVGVAAVHVTSDRQNGADASAIAAADATSLTDFVSGSTALITSYGPDFTDGATPGVAAYTDPSDPSIVVCVNYVVAGATPTLAAQVTGC